MKHVGFGGEAEPVDEDLRAAWRSKLEREGGLATAVYVSLSLRRPLLLEGEVGVGKTEIAKVLASVLGRSLIRLQCYEGIDTSQALYEWDYARQLLHIRALSEPADVKELFGPEFLLEMLSDFQISIPEIGTIAADPARARTPLVRRVALNQRVDLYSAAAGRIASEARSPRPSSALRGLHSTS